MRLSELRLNHKAIIKKLYSTKTIHRRFQDLGFIPGNIVSCVLISPFQNPKAFKINGMVLAIRNEDSANIEVEESE